MRIRGRRLATAFQFLTLFGIVSLMVRPLNGIAIDNVRIGIQMNDKSSFLIQGFDAVVVVVVESVADVNDKPMACLLLAFTLQASQWFPLSFLREAPLFLSAPAFLFIASSKTKQLKFPKANATSEMDEKPSTIHKNKREKPVEIKEI